jgi:tRNA(fMet)-specific endonuclease VapC
MNLLFDTNMILAICRDKSGHKVIEFFNPDEAIIYVSFVNIAEIQSIAFQNKWGTTKMRILEDFLDSARIIEITDLLIPTYIGIDAYSQKNHPDYESYSFQTPRNMGKNDLWIAATASLLNLKLVTTDGDFDHLDNTFLSLQKVLPSQILSIE